jgi:hypothetical protein
VLKHLFLLYYNKLKISYDVCPDNCASRFTRTSFGAKPIG